MAVMPPQVTRLVPKARHPWWEIGQTPLAELRAGTPRRPHPGTTAAAPDGAGGGSEMQPACRQAVGSPCQRTAVVSCHELLAKGLMSLSNQHTSGNRQFNEGIVMLPIDDIHRQCWAGCLYCEIRVDDVHILDNGLYSRETILRLSRRHNLSVVELDNN